MSHQQPQPALVLFEWQLGECKADDGRAMVRGQVVVVGLVAGVGRLAKLLGGERLQHADLVTGGGERALRRQMIVAGPFDRHEQVHQSVLGLGLT